jgi:hypothetical protein
MPETSPQIAISGEVSMPLRKLCPKRGMSDAPRKVLAAMKRVQWVEKSLLGDPWGYAKDASEAFRTVSLPPTLFAPKKAKVGQREVLRIFHALG